MTYASGDLGRREASAVCRTVESLRQANEIMDGDIREYQIVVQHLAEACLSMGLTLQSGASHRLVANVYAEVADAHRRRVCRDHLADAIAQDA